jgi:hypothetical protein
MELRPIGRGKVRKGGYTIKRGAPALIVPGPKQVRLFCNVEAGQIAEVLVDEENKRIVYQLL